MRGSRRAKRSASHTGKRASRVPSIGNDLVVDFERHYSQDRLACIRHEAGRASQRNAGCLNVIYRSVQSRIIALTASRYVAEDADSLVDLRYNTAARSLKCNRRVAVRDSCVRYSGRNVGVEHIRLIRTVVQNEFRLVTMNFYVRAEEVHYDAAIRLSTGPCRGTEHELDRLLYSNAEQDVACDRLRTGKSSTIYYSSGSWQELARRAYRKSGVR